jgi:hypothetical protein
MNSLEYPNEDNIFFRTLQIHAKKLVEQKHFDSNFIRTKVGEIVSFQVQFHTKPIIFFPVIIPAEQARVFCPWQVFFNQCEWQEAYTKLCQVENTCQGQTLKLILTESRQRRMKRSDNIDFRRRLWTHTKVEKST